MDEKYRIRISRMIGHAAEVEDVGEYNTALGLFKRAEEIDASNPDIYINRALFYRHRGDFEAAQRDYEKAMSLEPKGFNLLLLNQSDLVDYGHYGGVLTEEEAPMAKMVGMVLIDLSLSPDKEVIDTYMFVDKEELPDDYFVNKD